MCSYALLCLVFFCKIVSSRDFYAGVFNTNDFLVAQDRLYKERVMYRTTYAKYGRYFKCPITYFRVLDRLGVGKGPRVEVTRGGLNQKFIALRLTSPYSLPISVNIYVGCENKKSKKRINKDKMITPITTVTEGESVTTITEDGNATTVTGDPNATTVTGDPNATTVAGDENATTVAGDEKTTYEETFPTDDEVLQLKKAKLQSSPAA